MIAFLASVLTGVWSALCLLATCLSWLGLLLVCALVVQFVLVLLSDCNLRLRYCLRWGKKPRVFKGKVVWITGASSGIGEALAYVFAKEGAKVILSARREAELRRVREKCKELSPDGVKNSHNIMVLPLDILQTERHEDACLEVLQYFGVIDILINNAGRSQRAVAMDTHPEVDRAIIELNTLSTLALTKVVLPHMAAQKSGSVITVSSVAGKLGAPGSASYSASKHALQGFFDTLRMEVADLGIHILTVCPGPITTSFSRALLGNKLDEVPEQKGGVDENRLSAERCAYLIAVAAANKLEEVWISTNPVLLFTYINQYAPDLAFWMGKRIGAKRLKAVKKGLQNIDGSFFKFKS